MRQFRMLAGALIVCCFITACDTASPVAPSPVVPHAPRIELVAVHATLVLGLEPVRVQARVLDDRGVLAALTPIRFRASEGGRVTPADAVTSRDGYAEVAVAGDRAVTLTASALGAEATLELPAVPPFAVSIHPLQTPSPVGYAAVWIVVALPRATVPPPAIVSVTCGGQTFVTQGFVGDWGVSCAFPVPGAYAIAAEARTASGWTERSALTVNAVAPVPVQ